jgi:hypothetical protein
MHSIVNAGRYSLRHVKLSTPRRNCTARWSEGARKNISVKQKRLKVRIRDAQTATKLLTLRGRAASSFWALARNRMRSTDKATPWMAPNTT